MATMRIQPDRLHDSLRSLARIGATSGGGVNRLALSDEDREGRDLVQQWMRDAGLDVRVDDLGNIIGRRAGRAELPPVTLGSHTDTVRNGGRYDGSLGVLGALEVVRTLNDLGVTTRHPIEVVDWTNEEGARFEPAMMASGAVAGEFTREYVYGRIDVQGRRFGDELLRIGYQGREEDRPAVPIAYLELHIEQGPTLEEFDVPVGVVEGIVGITWLQVTVEGQADHAGPTPMHLRRDALLAAARIIDGIDMLVRSQDEVAVGTVGRIAVEPNVINVIPGRVVFSVDLRHPVDETLETLVSRLETQVSDIAVVSAVTATVDRFWTSEPTPFDPVVTGAISDAMVELGLPDARLWSGAGHDAKYMAQICPTAMIFVRSQQGLSHCEAEYSTPGDIEAGANVLLLAAMRLAGIET